MNLPSACGSADFRVHFLRERAHALDRLSLHPASFAVCAMLRPPASVGLLWKYAYVDRLGQDEDVRTHLAPKHQIYGEANWRITPEWNLNANVKSVLDRERPSGDPRLPIDDYSIVNLTLQRRNIANHVDAAISIRNLLDANAREPRLGDFIAV